MGWDIQERQQMEKFLPQVAGDACGTTYFLPFSAFQGCLYVFMLPLAIV